jgi:serine/threonine-protein kinase
MGSSDMTDRTDSFEESIRKELRPDFELVRRLGGGPLSTVFLAREPALQRLVAVKVLHATATRRTKSMARFRRETRALARVSHPSVVSIFRVGDLASQTPYLVMQYVRGTSLAERLKEEGALGLQQSCSLLAAVASALSAVHAHGIVHRDVRPESLLCGEPDARVLLADFGLASFLEAEDSSEERLTTAGHRVTDLEYSAPEFLVGEEPTSASDLYSLGILAYHVLTGAGPYEASTVTGRVHAHLHEPPIRLVERGIEAPGDLQRLLDACLAKRPGGRPTAADCDSRLQAIAGRIGDDRVPTSGRDVRFSAGGPPGEGPQPELYLQLLGGLDLAARGKRQPSIVRQPKRVALLAYLAAGTEGGFRRRDSLTGLFWPEADPDSARHSLRQAIYVLRREVGSETIRTRGDGEVGVDPALMVCDVARFESMARNGRPADAMEHYGGDLLPGFYVDDAPEFEGWLAVERVRLRRLAAQCCWDLSKTAESRPDPAEAARRARQAVDLDPFDETALHRLIELLDTVGDRAGAVAAFEHFAHRLAAEYAVDPSPETLALVQRVRARQQ